MSRLKKMIVGSDVRATARRAILLALFTLLLFRYVLLPVRVRGISMEPSYRDGSIHLVNLLSWTTRSPHRGEVVVISMTGRHALYFKRVLGLPGETVAFANGRLLINGREEAEPYLTDRGDWNLPEVKVGPDEFFVAGDNRSVPIETHALGLVHRSKIVGGILF